jgi:hypothetical protein
MQHFLEVDNSMCNASDDSSPRLTALRKRCVAINADRSTFIAEY